MKSRSKTAKTVVRREKIRLRLRKKIKGTASKPRLSVFRSNQHIYAQLIDDVAGVTLATASSKDQDIAGKEGTKQEIAFMVGEAIGQRATEKGIKDVIFDRGGYLYHGRVKQLAEGARKRDEEGNCTLLQF
ncbi:MAG: 50S ribosomal protein L18 [Saprospiraceae bacterium]|nr:50S ribosomal protein L18 [Saprospiraceae bacterium]